MLTTPLPLPPSPPSSPPPSWFAPAPISAGFIAVLVGYTSSAAIVFQAAHAAFSQSDFDRMVHARRGFADHQLGRGADGGGGWGVYVFFRAADLGGADRRF